MCSNVNMKYLGGSKLSNIMSIKFFQYRITCKNLKTNFPKLFPISPAHYHTPSRKKPESHRQLSLSLACIESSLSILANPCSLVASIHVSFRKSLEYARGVDSQTSTREGHGSPLALRTRCESRRTLSRFSARGASSFFSPPCRFEKLLGVVNFQHDGCFTAGFMHREEKQFVNV